MSATLSTLAHSCRHEILIQRSRFLAHAAPVESAVDAMASAASLAHADASHNCWAWRVGDAYRSSDDGEPAGTAGRPILAAIDGQAMDRIVVVVARWFGGIKLGAGGLVRAYGGCAAECLRLADRRAIVISNHLACVVDFAIEPALRSLLPSFDAEIVRQHHDADGVHLVMRVPAERSDQLKARLTDLSRGRALFPTPD